MCCYIFITFVFMSDNKNEVRSLDDLEIWRAFSWMEDVRIDEINKKNEQ